MAAKPAVMPGCAAGLYLNSGSHDDSVWDDQTSVKDVEPSSPWVFADTQSRATPIKLYAKTTIDLPVKVTMRADPADPIFSAWVEAAFNRGTIFDLLILNAKINVEGAVGLRGPYLVSLTEAPQPLEGTIYVTFECRPTISELAVVPTFVEMIANSVPSETDITY